MANYKEMLFQQKSLLIQFTTSMKICLWQQKADRTRWSIPSPLPGGSWNSCCPTWVFTALQTQTTGNNTFLYQFFYPIIDLNSVPTENCSIEIVGQIQSKWERYFNKWSNIKTLRQSRSIFLLTECFVARGFSPVNNKSTCLILRGKNKKTRISSFFWHKIFWVVLSFLVLPHKSSTAHYHLPLKCSTKPLILLGYFCFVP